MPATTSRILLVDDDADVLEMLNEWLGCCGYDTRTALNGLDALEILKQHPFDVVITDLKMPGLNGLQLLSLFKESDPTLEVIFLSGQGTMEDAIAALREGRAFDFIQKPVKDLRQLNLVIEKAITRRRSLAQPAKPPRTGGASFPRHLEELTPREIEIIALLAEGLENREVAERLVLSEKTIKNHLTRIYEKLEVSNRTQAVVMCQQYGLT